MGKRVEEEESVRGGDGAEEREKFPCRVRGGPRRPEEARGGPKRQNGVPEEVRGGPKRQNCAAELGWKTFTWKNLSNKNL